MRGSETGRLKNWRSVQEAECGQQRAPHMNAQAATHQASPGSWVSLLWNQSAGQGRVHPEDARHLPAAGGGTFLCLGRDATYVTVDTPSGPARVEPFSVVVLPRPPALLVGSKAAVRRERGLLPHTATVASLGWHFKDARYTYHLNGTTKRYNEDDLEAAA